MQSDIRQERQGGKENHVNVSRVEMYWKRMQRTLAKY